MRADADPFGMSHATKVVVGTIAISAVLALALIASFAVLA